MTLLLNSSIKRKILPCCLLITTHLIWVFLLHILSHGMQPSVFYIAKELSQVADPDINAGYYQRDKGCAQPIF